MLNFLICVNTMLDDIPAYSVLDFLETKPLLALKERESEICNAFGYHLRNFR